MLLTCDVHTHTQKPEQVATDLSQARTILGRYRWPCTFMFPSTSAALLPHQVRSLCQDGHEIGCHGLTHEADENFAILPSADQRTVLLRATQQLTEIVGDRPTSFRAPAFKASGATLQCLDDLGYQADLSIVAGKLGIFGSDIYNWRPTTAIRRPYHPSPVNPYRRGPMKLWEIPVSALGLPFLSNTERLAGLAFMKVFFRALYVESRLTGKPIVFVFHAEDLNAERPVEQVGRLSWKHFLPTRTHGFMFRYFLFERNWRLVHRDLVALLQFIEGFPGVRFLTVRDYLATMGQQLPVMA